MQKLAAFFLAIKTLLQSTAVTAGNGPISDSEMSLRIQK